MKIKIHRAFSGKPGSLVPHFWFTVIARNGRVTSTSETYTRRDSAVRTAKTYRFYIINP